MAMILDDPDWVDRAACAGRGAEWFPGKSDGLSSLEVRRAKRVCIVNCPVQRECLERAFERRPKFGQITTSDGDYLIGVTGWRTEEEDGIWGGTTPAERKATAGMPTADRIELLLSWTRSQTTGKNAVATPEEVADVIAS